MKFGKSIESFSPSGEEDEESRDKPENQGRRDFLKKAGIVGAGLFVGGALDGIRTISKIAEKEERKEELTRKAFEEWKRGGEKRDEASEGNVNLSKEERIEEQEREEMEEDDIKTMGEVLDFDSDKPIKFNLDTVRALKNNFKKRYKGKDRKSLEYAYYEMGAWEKKLKEIFKEKGVPEKLIYLAIPESHWKFKAESPVGAAGPYQIITATGRELGLMIDDKIDERLDPLKSAGACAKYLKQMYEQLGDWNLAISRYNGGFAKRYMKSAENNSQPISYEKFLKYMENKLNETKSKIKTSKNLFHEVRKGDTLGKIARRYGVAVNELRNLSPHKISGKNRDIIKVGDEINLPLTNEVRKIVFLSKVSGYRENLNYPAKFNAVVELINKGFVTKKKREIEYRTVPVEGKEKKEYIIRHGDTLYGVSRKFNITVDELKEINAGIKVGDLRIGHKIKVPTERTSSLAGMAIKLKKNLKKLCELNPAIADVKAPIPEGYVLRV